MKGQGLEPQPLVFLSSPPKDHTNQTTSMIRTQDLPNTIGTQSNEQTYSSTDHLINALINELNSGTKPLEVSVNIAEDNSKSVSVDIKDAIQTDNRNNLDLNDQKMKSFLPNKVDQPLKIISDDFNQGDLPHSSIGTDEIPPKITVSTTVTTLRYSPYPYSTIAVSKTDLKPEDCESNRSDVNRKFDEKMLSDTQMSYQIPGVTTLKPMSLGVTTQTELDAYKQDSSQVYVNSHIPGSSFEVTVTEIVKLEDTNGSTDTNTNPVGKYDSHQVTFVTSDRQLPSLSTDFSTTKNSVSGINEVSQHHDDYDMVSPDSYTSISTKTTVNINLIERKSSENKSRASQTINSSTPSESYLTTSLLHSTPPDNLDFVQSSTSAPYPTTYPSSAMITSNTRRMFHQIYKCRHLHTSVIMNMDNESDSCNSMCDLCKHMSNLHTLISSLQSHLLSNRQNRLSNLLPIDIESFTQSSSLISSLSTYWSPIIKEYLSIICEIKSELNSFQSSSPSSSALEYKIIHLPEYKSMDDLLNIWNCRLQDFLCLRSSNISNSGVNIPQTRWLTLFISLIQHNEIQVEYLKSVFTSLIHFIQNENDETMKHELEVHNNEKSYLSNSCIPGIVKGESHPYHIYQHLPTEILSLSSKHQYLDDLKSRLFSHELLDQEKSMLLPRQLSPSSTHSILVVPNDNITQSLQPKTEEKDDSHRSSTVFTTTDVCMMHDEDEESQKSLEVHNSDHISFGQDLSGQIQSSGKNGKSIQNAEILKEFNGGDSDQTQWITVQKRKVKKAKKHKCKNQDQARGRKTTTETTTTTTSIINDNNTNKGDFTDNEDARDKTAENIQTHPSIYPPGVPDAVHPCGLILESKIQTAKSEDTGESEPCVDQSRISFCLRSATLNSRLLPSFHETCLRGSDEMKSYVTENDEVKSNDVLNVLLQNSSINGDNQGTIWGRGSLQTSDSIEDNGTVKDFKPNITDTNLEEKVRRHETMTYTNKSNDLASWITIQSDSSPSVTDINTVSGVNAGEKKLYRFHNISNTFPEDSKQSSRSCVTVDTEIKQEGSRSDAYSTSSDVFNREIIKPAVEFDLPVKSEKCMKADKKHFQGWLQSPTNADLKSLEPVVTCNRNSKDIDSSITGSKNVLSQPQRQIKIDFLPDKRTGRKDTNDQLDQELLPEEKKHSFPRSSVFNEAIKNDESISADVYDSHKSELYSYHPENDSDNRQTLGSNGSALVTSKFVKTITKIANSDFTSDVSLPSSSLSVSNEKDHVTHNFVSTKRKIRKVNRTAINRRQDKSIMPGELKPTAVNNQSPTNQMNNSQDQLTQHTTVSVKCKNHSESNSGASSHSSSPRLVHTLGTPTTISLKPSWSNSYQISSSSDENKIHNNIIDEVSTPVYHQHEFLRNVERYPTSVVLNTTAISSHEIAQSHSNMFSPTNNRIQREKIKLTFSTPSTSPLSLQTTDDDDSYLPTNKLNIDEHEVFKKSITGDKYHLIDTNKSLTDAEQSAFKQRTHLNRSSVCDAVTSPYDKSDSLKKRQKVDFTSLSKYHDLYSDDLDVNSSWDQHGFHSFSQHRYRDTHRNRRLRHEQQHPYHHSEQVESVRVLRQTPIIKENELLNTSLTGFKRFGSDVHISNRVHSSSPELFHPDNRMSDSFLTSNIVGYSELQRRQITSTDASGEVSSLRSGESIPAKMSKTRRRFCRLLPYLLLMLPILFLFFLILCIFFIPGCPLLLPWLKCNEKSPTGEWFYSPFVLFHVNDPPF
ncbi:unnamed protein product [Heterobilharzia americana]|nr:unnamed protein product [Heterobilharzia americana]